MDDAARRAEKLIVDFEARFKFVSSLGRDDLRDRIATALRELEAERDELRTKAEKIIDDRDSQIGRVMQERNALATRLAQYEQTRKTLVETAARSYEQVVTLRARLARVEGALRPFTSGGNWGKWKAWLVEGARHLGKVSEGLDAAQAITRWQCQVDEAVAALTPDATRPCDIEPPSITSQAIHEQWSRGVTGRDPNYHHGPWCETPDATTEE